MRSLRIRIVLKTCSMILNKSICKHTNIFSSGLILVSIILMCLQSLEIAGD